MTDFLGQLVFYVFFIRQVESSYIINVRKYRRTNQNWTIQINWQHTVHKTKNNKTKTTQYVLDTTMRKQIQITYVRHAPSYKQLHVYIATCIILSLLIEDNQLSEPIVFILNIETNIPIGNMFNIRKTNDVSEYYIFSSIFSKPMMSGIYVTISGFSQSSNQKL